MSRNVDVDTVRNVVEIHLPPPEDVFREDLA